jgi:hypothetical protein
MEPTNIKIKITRYNTNLFQIKRIMLIRFIAVSYFHEKVLSYISSKRVLLRLNIKTLIKTILLITKC